MSPGFDPNRAASRSAAPILVLAGETWGSEYGLAGDGRSEDLRDPRWVQLHPNSRISRNVVNRASPKMHCTATYLRVQRPSAVRSPGGTTSRSALNELSRMREPRHRYRAQR